MTLEDITATPEGYSLTSRLHMHNGMHARPAARLAKEIQRFQARVTIHCDMGEADAKSMLDILSLAMPDETELTVTAEGSDAREALAAVAAFLENTVE